MYRILLADDEGIMLESLRHIIESNFGEDCEIACAKTGRMVIEQAESFKPDIAFMDIQMPGINGIEAMKEIMKFHSNTIFIVISAYDKFDYAKEAINLGVMEYLTKPVNRKVIVEVLLRAMNLVEQRRKKYSDDLKIREKLETVIPVIESGFISSILMQDGTQEELDYYTELMDIREEHAYACILGFGENYENGKLTNPIGMSVKAQKFYRQCREIIREYFSNAVIGPVMSNRIVMIIPHEKRTVEYEERIQIIERSRSMIRKLESRIDAKFRLGIGRNDTLEELRTSYKEAYRALNEGGSRVMHFEDLPQSRVVDENYPIQVEKELFLAIEHADRGECQNQADLFFEWMIENYHDYQDNIRLKVLELVMRAESFASTHGKREYGFLDRKDYMETIRGILDYEDLKKWFKLRLDEVCIQIQNKSEEQSEGIIFQAKEYIREHFDKDISLEDVSKVVNISPYYFSKLFKEESGVNFIDYLTKTRMKHAKDLLKDPGLSIKQVCMMSGYSDPNYFSRIFKKQEDITPSEYRERIY